MPNTMDGSFDGILDIYHDDDVSLQDAQNAGIIAVIHKASEGATVQDPMYPRRRHEAAGLGFLWGAYHFSSGKPPDAQAANFLNAVQWGADPTSDSSTLLCLDFENSHSGPNMSIQDACTFVSIVHDKTGRWPLVYGSNLVQDADKTASLTCALANCPLWYANYNDAPQQAPHRLWTTFALWQYTDGTYGPAPRDVGTQGLDRSCFIGTEDALQQAWPNLTSA
jgi:lysozyme